jgi:glucokinase
MKNLAIGADIGGSHIYCAAVDLDSHDILSGTGSHRSINNKASADEILDGWTDALRETLSNIDLRDLTGIGFAMPGPFDYSKGIALFERVEKYESLYGKNISEELKKRLGLEDTKFRYINDATAFAIAESWVGNAGGHKKMIALTLGTGFGSAFMDSGIPVIAGDTVPEMGCVWHLPFKSGIANDYFSTPWFIRNYKERSGHTVSGVKELHDRADDDPIAMDLFEEYGANMGRFLSPWIRRFNAKIIVIGGNITGAFDLFGRMLKEELIKDNTDVEVLLSDLKEDAAVLGGARLITEEYWQKVEGLLPLM